MYRSDRTPASGCLSFGLNGCAIPFALLSALGFSAFMAVSLHGPPDFKAIAEATYPGGYKPDFETIRFASSVAKFLPLAAFGIFGFLAAGLKWLSGKVSQVPRDAWARSLPERLRAGSAEPYFLFLRAFKTSGALVTFSSPASPLSISEKLKSPHLQFEYSIFQALDPLGPVLCLGVPGEAVGASRVAAPDADWKELLALLAAKASAIVCIPSHTAGSFWEAAHLVEAGLLQKTVFCMPAASPRMDVAQEWERSRDALKSIGLLLPPYVAKGALFKLEAAGGVSREVPLDGKSKYRLRNLLSSMLPPSVAN